jgi:hypothetical protein
MTIREDVYYQLYPIYLGTIGVRRISPTPIAGEADAADIYPWELASTSEPQSFCHGGNWYYPVWIEPDGTEWGAYEAWECCEHTDDPKKLEEYLENMHEYMKADVPAPYDCSNHVEYAGGGRALCGKHFEEIKLRSRVLWELHEEFDEDGP